MTTSKTERARQLRHRQTDAESKLWQYLRNRQLSGVKFRRQVPLGRYVVDFLSDAQKLIIELDGGHHNVDTDRERTEWLESEGYRVIRFWNNEVTDNIEGVLAHLERFIGT